MSRIRAVLADLKRHFVDADPASMTLEELVEEFPALFRQDQTWWNGEAFAYRVLPDGRTPRTPDEAVDLNGPPTGELDWTLPSAIELAVAYVRDPKAAIWTRYLWTRDVDAQGQRVFLGVNRGRMEIHRHLHITERWGVPLFDPDPSLVGTPCRSR